MKARTFYDRVFLVFCSVLFTISAVFCSYRPINVYADSVIGPADIADDIRDFYDDAKEELDRVERAIASDINNGNLSQSSALYTEYMSALSLQAAMVSSPTLYTLATLASVYGDGVSEAQKFVEYLNNNPTIEFTGSSRSGLYKSDIDNKFHTLSCFVGQGTNSMYFSDEFTLTWKVTNISDSYSTNTLRSGSSERYDYIYSYIPTSSHTITFPNSTFFTNPYSQTWNWSNSNYVNTSVSLIIGDQNTSIPTIRQSINWSNYVSKTSGLVIAANGVTAVIPTESVESETPWTYYNNTIMPYMQQNYPHVTNNYYIFPNGYLPAPHPTDPPEPTSPSGDLVLPPYGELVTEASSYYVTDESGETVTDESGEPLTETTMIPVTSVTVENGNYLFRVPTLPSIYMTDTGELNISLPIKYASICGGLFSACYDVLDSSGIFSVLPFLVGMAVIVYVIYKVGG